MEKSLKMYDLQEIFKAIGMPDGYKAENIQIVNGKICYEEVKIKKSIKEIVDSYQSKPSQWYYIHNMAHTSEINCDMISVTTRNALPTPDKCEQILALEQLIMNCWIVNGCKELERNEIQAMIIRDDETDEIHPQYAPTKGKYVLNFTSLKIAQEFYETYKYLIETAKPLL